MELDLPDYLVEEMKETGEDPEVFAKKAIVRRLDEIE